MMKRKTNSGKHGLSIQNLLLVSFLIPVTLLVVFSGNALLTNISAATFAKQAQSSHQILEQWQETEHHLLQQLFSGLAIINTPSPAPESTEAFSAYFKDNRAALNTLIDALPKATSIKASALTNHEFLKLTFNRWNTLSESLINHEDVPSEQWIAATKELRHAIDDLRLTMLSPQGNDPYIQYQQLLIQPSVRNLSGLILDEALLLDSVVYGQTIDQSVTDQLDHLRKQGDAEKTRLKIAFSQISASRHTAEQTLNDILQRHDELLRLLNLTQRGTHLNATGTDDKLLTPQEWYSSLESILLGVTAMESAISKPLNSAIITHQSYSQSMVALTAGGSAVIILSLLILFMNLRHRVLKPIENLAALMGMMTRNDYPAEPPSHHFNDEIGQMYEMLGQFQGNIEIIEDQKEDIRIAMQKAEESTRMKSEFLASMSHEIRTPLNGVIGTANLLLDTELKHDQRSYAQTVVSSANNLLQLVNDILDLSKIEAGKLELEAIPFDLRQTIEEVGDLMAVKAYEKHMELLLRFAPDAPRYVLGDPSRIRQIFLNLCNNALKFTESGHVVINVETRSISTDKATFYISIEDTGIGIAADKLGTIFEKFSQADGSMSRKYGGTGLGLTICQQLIALMHGDIGVTSEVGVGSTFWVTMELGIDKASIRPASNMGLTDLRVIVVDDNKRALSIDSETLTAQGMQVETAHNANEAFEKMSGAANDGKGFHFAVIDYIMPELDGIDLARMIEQNTLLSDMVLVMTTSSPSRGDDQRVQSLGFEGYLTKHATGLYLAAALSRIWKARTSDQNITLVTQHNLRERRDRRNAGEEMVMYDGVWVLLVEDNPVNQMVATKTLGKYGLHVITANDGAEAIELYPSREFHLVFMDCQMPIMDGFDATRGIRAYEQKNAGKRTPVIAFTANTMKGDEEKCRESGMDDFISKPFQPEDLKAKLVKWLGAPDSDTDASAA